MRSSRNSAFLINTGCSSNKKVLAPFISSFEAYCNIVVGNVLQKLLTDALLDVACRWQILFLERLQICWNRHSADIPGSGQARLVEPPFGDHTITVKTSLERPRCFAIMVRIVATYDGAKLDDIE